MSTVLMQSTFRIEGPSRALPGKTSIGTIFIIGKPLKSDPSRLAYVLVTPAHVLDDISGPRATLLVRRKNGDGTYVAYFWPIAIRDQIE